MEESVAMDVDIWVRGQHIATTRQIADVPADATLWTDSDVKSLLEQMLSALEREKNPDGEAPPITLRGFSWIVSPQSRGVLVHLEMQMGTASAGPFDITESRLTDMIARVMGGARSSTLVH